MGETETTAPIEPSSRSARRRRMEVHQFNFVPNDTALANSLPKRKRQRIELISPRECDNAIQTSGIVEPKSDRNSGGGGEAPETKAIDVSDVPSGSASVIQVRENPKFGLTSVCGRRRDMEDAVAIHPSFSRRSDDSSTELHFFGVYDGHGCSHVINPILN